MSQSDFRSIIILSQLKVMILPLTKPNSHLSDGIMFKMIEYMLMLYHTTLRHSDLQIIEDRLAHIFREMINQKMELDNDTVMLFAIHFSLLQFKFLKNQERIDAWGELKKYAEKHSSISYNDFLSKPEYSKYRDFISNFEKLLGDINNNERFKKHPKHQL